MSIVRGPRPHSNFYVLDKRISDDKRLSWGARGLLVFLLGKPDHWEVSIANLVNETAASLRSAGGNTKRDGVKALVAELIAAGYVTRSDKPKHNGDGSFAGYDYIVAEAPIDVRVAIQPSPDNPSMAPSPDQPSPPQPSPPHPTQVSIEEAASIEKAAIKDKARALRFDAQAHLVDSLGVDLRVARDWLSLRKAKRAASTETALSGVLREARRASISMNAALQMCCTRGWVGFNADWVNPGATSRPGFTDVKSESRRNAYETLTGRSNRHDNDDTDNIIDI